MLVPTMVFKNRTGPIGWIGDRVWSGPIFLKNRKIGKIIKNWKPVIRLEKSRADTIEPVMARFRNFQNSPFLSLKLHRFTLYFFIT